MQKIPFAIDLLSGELVEVGQVKSGRDCGCVCMSCGQSVIARKGDVNQWHFAHDSKGPIPPHSLCEISFYVCCKRFVVEQLLKNEMLILSTPSYSVSDKQIIKVNDSLKSITFSMVVTEERRLTVDSFSKDGNLDLVVNIGKHTIDILLSYPGRALPQVMDEVKPVLLIDLVFIADSYDSIRTTSVLIQKAVIELFSTDVKHKRWLFHPRELPARAKLIEKLEVELKTAQIVKQQPQTKTVMQIKKVSCKMCNEKWGWTASEPVICKRCNTHLFVVFDDPH